MNLIPTIIDIAGDDREIGRAHARASLDMLPAVREWAGAVGAAHPIDTPSVRTRVEEVRQAWARLCPGLLEQISGMAEVYGMAEDDLLVAVLGTYLRSGDRALGSTDGCTAIALPGDRPLLAKNRDNEPRYLALQTVLRVQPVDGHRWLALSTAGAPGVHSSGLNEHGLCIADTHVASSDIGPGVPRFGTMQQVLTKFTTTAEAVQHILDTPQMGLGTLTIVDAEGQAAVVECGYAESSVRRGAVDRGEGRGSGGVGTTNHYTQDALTGCVLEPEDGTPGASSRARRGAVDRVLAGAPLDRATLKEFMSSHLDFDGENGALGSICQHGPGLHSETISTVLLDPLKVSMELCLGRPCTHAWTTVPVLAGN